MNKKTKRVALTATACGLVAALGVGASLAYMTDAEQAVNTFTVGNVGIELLEANYPGNDADAVKDLVPNQEVAKDPKIVNRKVNDAVVFMTVDSPMENVSLVSDNGATAAKAIQEIFYFKDETDGINAHENNFDNAWTELTDKKMYVKIAANGTETAVAEADLADAFANLTEGDHIVNRYVFAYNTEIQGSSTHDGDAQTVGTNDVTSTLFEKIQLKNILENEIDLMTEFIQVRGYAIQADNIVLSDGEAADWSADADKAEVYDIYIRQNSAGTGNNANITSGKGVASQYIEGIRGADPVTATDNGRSDTDDTHVNRWDTNADVTGTGENVKPAPVTP